MWNHGATPQLVFLKRIYPEVHNFDDVFEHIPKDKQVLNEAWCVRPQEKQVCAARLCQFPFSASQIGRTLKAVKYSLLQASQKPCAKPTYDCSG